jgi:hypothetical protein
MKQAIAGVTPPELAEATVMTVWPSIAALGIGRWIGRMCLLGGKSPFAIGKLMAVLLIPLAINVFLHMLSPWGARRYRLTNRRVIVESGLRPVEERSVGFDRFDAIDVEVLPGQEWFPAGNLIFKKGAVETFRLAGVSRPETFRQTCLKAQKSFVAVKKFSAAR